MNFKTFLESKGPEFKTLEKNKVDLTDEERKQVIDADAVWNINDRPTAAVWKSIVNGKTWYVTNTHRCFQSAQTLKGAIGKYHRVVKGTA